MNRWNDRIAFLKKRAISGLYPYSAALPFGHYEQPELWVSKELAVCYVVNPKVASSSILVALTGLATGARIDRYWHNHPLVSRFRCTDFRQVPAGYFCFSLVRHPLDRVVSLYKEKFVRARLEGVPFEYETYLGGIFNFADSFDEFCAKIAKIPDRISDRHFVSQSFWFDKVCRARLDYVGHFENLDEEWAAISRRIGKQMELPQVNSSAGAAFARPMPSLLRARYAVDFDRFSYPS